MLTCEPAKCRNCGNESFYTKVLSWNTFIDPEYPARNICCNCGAEIKYDDIDFLTCSPSHREEVRLNTIYNRLSDKEKSANKEDVVCPQCGSNELSSWFSCGSNLPEKYKGKRNHEVHKGYYRCNKCGNTSYRTIEDILSSGIYEFVEKGENEYEYIVKYVDNYQEIIKKYEKQKKKKLEQIERELIEEGLITTQEEEREYADKYFKELREKYKIEIPER